MGVKLRKVGTTNSSRWEPVAVDGIGDFEVLVKKPSWDDLVRDSGLVGASPEDRIKMVVLDWRGVTEDDGKGGERPAPFSLDAVKVLCTMEPRLFWEINRLCNLAFAGLSDAARGAELKNSEGPLSGDSRDAASAELAPENQETTKVISETTGQSVSGFGSADSASSPLVPD